MCSVFKTQMNFITWLYQKLTIGFWGLLFPSAWRIKTKHVFNNAECLLAVLVQILNVSSQARRKQKQWLICNHYLCSACITSISSKDAMFTPHFAPRSTNSELKESIMMMVLRTGVWPFSRFCRSVSAFFWLSQSTVESSAETEQNISWTLIKLEGYCSNWNQYNLRQMPQSNATYKFSRAKSENQKQNMFEGAHWKRKD